MIPDKLYRGDSDKCNCRKLREYINKGMLFTNLISGGTGKIIFTAPLIELVKMHINNSGGWKSHFLSFTEKEKKAFDFGAYGFQGEHESYFEEDNNWDFAILIFTTSRLKSRELIEKGVYECTYDSSFCEFENGCRILLIDTVEYLIANSHLNINSELKNAQKDEEWLLLPTNSKLFNNGVVEYSAKVDMSNIIDFTRYKMIK